MSLNPGDIIHPFVIEGEIGEGGMAIVYRAQHTILGSTHAIKVLDEKLARNKEIRQRFLEEGRIQARLRHPHITPVSDIIAEEGVAGLVMPCLQGTNLEDHIAQTGPVPVSQAIEWFKQALMALSYVHSEGIVHRDLKPANIFLEKQPDRVPVVRLMDFGIAKVMDKSRTRTSMSMGTLAYMSPEQLRSPRSVDHRTDVFAMGAILYEMLSGKPAFHGDTDYETMESVVQGQFIPLRQQTEALPAHLDGIVACALSVEPSQRFESAAAFMEALDAAKAPVPLPQPPPTPQPTQAPTPQPTQAPTPQAPNSAQLIEAIKENTSDALWPWKMLDDGVWVSVADSNLYRVRLTPHAEGCAVHIRSAHRMGRQPFIPRADQASGGWPGASRHHVTSNDWYGGEPWLVRSAEDVTRIAWLIDKEWTGAATVPLSIPSTKTKTSTKTKQRLPGSCPHCDEVPVHGFRQLSSGLLVCPSCGRSHQGKKKKKKKKTQPAALPQPDWAAEPAPVAPPTQDGLVSQDTRHGLMAIGGIIGFLVGLPAGGIGAIPGAMIGAFVGAILPEAACCFGVVVIIGFIVALFFNV